MAPKIKIAEKSDLNEILSQLRKNSVQNAWAIQDLTIWPDRSKFLFTNDIGQFSYLLISGHPASQGHITVIANSSERGIIHLLENADINVPFVIRETPAHLLPSIQERYPNAKVYTEQRMDLTKDTFIPRHKGFARSLNPADAEALAQFFGAPPQAAGRFKGWLSGAKAFMGVFEGDRLAAIGSSMVNIPEAWNLVSIETHRDFRRKGYGTEITSALAAVALEKTPVVTLTVVKDNAPAIRTYEKIGFRFAEDRIWVDNGTGSKP